MTQLPRGSDRHPLLLGVDLTLAGLGLLSLIWGLLPYYTYNTEYADSSSKGFEVEPPSLLVAVVIGAVALVGLGRRRSLSRWTLAAVSLAVVLYQVGVVITFDSQSGTYALTYAFWLLLVTSLLQFGAAVLGGLVESGRVAGGTGSAGPVTYVGLGSNVGYGHSSGGWAAPNGRAQTSAPEPGGYPQPAHPGPQYQPQEQPPPDYLPDRRSGPSREPPTRSW